MHTVGSGEPQPEPTVNETKRERERTEGERWQALHRLEDWLETPMVVLGLVWLAILVAELLWGDRALLRSFGLFIWIVFILDFALRFTLAPKKIRYLKGNWITVVALALPAFRVLRLARVFRALRAARGLQLARLVTSFNRGMGALSRSMERRGARYVVALTALVTFAGGAGMYAFERPAAGGELESYPEALWWTAMLITTIGSEYWPQTPEGRTLALLLSVYALGMLGYITATLASFFIGRDAEAEEGEVAGDAALRALREEISALRNEVRELRPRRSP